MDTTNLTHVLLGSVDNLAVIWSIDNSGNVLRTKVFTTTAGFAPSRQKAGKSASDTNLRLAWKATDGSGKLQIMTINPSNLNVISTVNVNSPALGFGFQDFDADTTGVVYVLWTALFGAEITTTVNLTTGALSNAVQYGPYGAIDAVAINVTHSNYVSNGTVSTYSAQPTILWNYWPEIGTNENQIWVNLANNYNYYGFYTWY